MTVGEPWLGMLGGAGAVDIVTRRVTNSLCRIRMIRSFRDRRTQALYETSTDRRLPASLVRRVLHRLEAVQMAKALADLASPPGNRLHALSGDRIGQYAIAVNLQWRICFRWVDGDAWDVELCDYH
jgi:toxin HigB-1